jgi:hypothetical protein
MSGFRDCGASESASADERIGRVHDVEMYLAAVSEPVDPAEVRRFWNVTEAPTLHGLIRAAPKVRLGMTEAAYGENDNRRGPVGRVFDLIFLRGTTPVYCVPVLDEELEREILTAMGPLPEDPPFDTKPIDRVVQFLAEHRGSPVLIEVRPPDGELPSSESASPIR